jgi:PAS domain S-box-containing protein
MVPPGSDVSGISSLQPAWEDGDRNFYRALRDGVKGQQAILVVFPSTDPPTVDNLKRLTHEFDLRDDLADDSWAVQPLALLREQGQPVLVLKDNEGEPLQRLARTRMEVQSFLHLAIPLSLAIGRLHDRGLIHKDIKPANILANLASGQVWLTGFGIATRLSRERQPVEPPEFIAGTLAYMAPEQTGRMNRSIDSRSDLYSLGVTFYQMLTGHLPFTASDPMEWIHCHIARNAVPPSERVESVPIALSAIIMKLLAKTPEDRYQTARGVEQDLRRCLADWQSRGRIEDFPLGEHDVSDRLLIPERLYGRSREIDAMLAVFDRVVVGGAPELVLVSGYSGIGKSSVVDELQKALVPTRGLFASGKFDQHKRDIPYATLARAFQSLVRPLLGKSPAELQIWRDALQEALGPNGLLMLDIVPELKLILGEQPPLPELPPQDAQRRFQLVFGRFISVFASQQHPLVLFLDDLQWLDAATLDLLEDLLVQPDVKHLMFIGAYRSNEVDPSHPLARRLTAIRDNGAAVEEIVLAPLARQDLERLIADSVHCTLERAAPLAQLVHDKTGGNPFFAIQFISELAHEELLTFDRRASQWSWDLTRIYAKGYTDNIIDLMVGKLNRLTVETQTALQQLAYMGNRVEFDLLTSAYQGSPDEMHRLLWEAVRAGLIFRLGDSYRFAHDRVLEAAYSLTPEETRDETHLRIGTLLAKKTSPEKLEEAIFEIVNQLNRGSHLIKSADERLRVAELNLIAGRRAKSSTAYASALKYLIVARGLLSEDSWDRNYELMFSIEYLMAECELLTADMITAENRLSMLAERSKSSHHIAVVTRSRITLYTTLDRSDRAVEVCLEYLRRRGTDWSLRPSRNEVMREYERVWSILGGRRIEELLDLPFVTDTELLDLLDVLTETVTPALFYDENFSSLVICSLVIISLQHGNSDASCFAYVWFAIICGPRFNNYKDGFRFGQLGYELVEKRGLTRYQARTYMSFGDIVVPWTKHVRSGRDLVRRAFETATRAGDLTFSAYSCNHLVTNLLAAGDHLAEVQREAENGLEFAKKISFGLVIDHITAQLRLIRTLRGLTPTFGTFDDEQFNELQFERHLEDNAALAELKCWYWIRKLQARFFAGEYLAGVEASLIAQQLLWTSPSQFETAEFRFYGALCHAACWDLGTTEQKQQHFAFLRAHHEQLNVWAANCPENFGTRALLVSAEIARIEGQDLIAMRLYDEAILRARENGFIHNEALANEIAARFYSARGFEKIAYAYLRDARYCYLRWGADGKVRQLEQIYPLLRERTARSDPTSTIQAPVESLELDTVLKVSQAVSGETVLEKLIDTIMRTAIQHAGAQRCVLLLTKGIDLVVRADAEVHGESLVVHLLDAPLSMAALPVSIVHFVVRTRERIILGDASAQNQFSADPYIRRHQARSVLCFPLLSQDKLIGILYLEHNLAPGVFTSDRMAVLKLLASEAAISLENARLYSDLREREAKVRRLVNANIIGIFIWRFDGRLVDANDAFLRIVGYSRDDFVSGDLEWRELTPVEWRDQDNRRAEELRATGISHPYEKEYLRKDGSRVPVLVGAALFEERGDEGVAFVIDLTDRKKAEEVERRYMQVQTELAHANRLAAMGQLSASIAHEINQPIGSAITYANAASSWLRAQPPNLEEVQQALGFIVESGVRAGEVIDRIRALVKKAPPLKARLNINEAILEVIALVRGEMAKNGISAKTQLADSLPPVWADRVQLQQVVLNLLLNAIEAMSGMTEGACELLIRTEQTHSDAVLVSVQDSGPGFPPESAQRLFESFYTTKPGGLGMGLSICHSIIEAHQGRLWASANLPRGAVFQFTLPALLSGEGDKIRI